MVVRKERHILDELNYYLLIFLLLIFMLGASYFIMPVLLVLPALVSYGVLIMLGLIFGLMTSYFISTMDSITHHHHAGIWFIVIAGAMISFVVMWGAMPEDSKIGTGLQPLFVGWTFCIAFLLPYYLYLRRTSKR